MSGDRAPTLEHRDAAGFLGEILARRLGYEPRWSPREGGPAWAVSSVYAHHLHALAEGVNQAPNKHKLAFLDLLGIALLPAQAARTPAAFEPLPGGANSRVPAGTRIGASVPGEPEPISFETERSIALAAARLVEVMSVWPGRDAYADHTADVVGGRPFTLFEPLQPIPHELYLAHDVHFALAGRSTVELEVELTQESTRAFDLTWAYWDGESWRAFKGFTSAALPEESFDGTSGLRRSGVIRLEADCAETKRRKVRGRESFWIRASLTHPLPPDASARLPLVDRIGIRTVITRPVADDCLRGLQLDQAFADGQELDVTKVFYPFGQQPGIESAFYGRNAEAFSRPGARLTFCLRRATTPQEEADAHEGTDGDDAAADDGKTPDLPGAELAWEYWNGRDWIERVSPLPGALTQNLLVDGSVTIDVPDDWEPCVVNGVRERWLRIRVARGSFNRLRVVSWSDEAGENVFSVLEPRPPALEALLVGYEWRSAPAHPHHCLTFSDFQWSDRSEDARWRGTVFEPFSCTQDSTPALYLGFDQPLPADVVGLYIGVTEAVGEEHGPRLVWEQWSGTAWLPVSVVDETSGLARPGTVEVLWPGGEAPPAFPLVRAESAEARLVSSRDAAQFAAGDLVWIASGEQGELATVADIRADAVGVAAPLDGSFQGGTIARAPLPRFGTPRTWLRARLVDDGEPRQSVLEGIWANATWAAQVQTTEGEVLGSGSGQPRQVVFFRNSPVLPGEVVEVRELEGARAPVELPLLERELAAAGIAADAVRKVTDPRTRRLTEVWVPWEERPNLFFSHASDRHYVLERSRGRLLFGDGRRGRMPPAGADNVRARCYRFGGGARGNVGAGKLDKVLAGVVVQSVSNPASAAGGAEAEVLDSVRQRGPATIRHRRQALTLADYEALAREASPAVAFARAVAADREGRPVPGRVSVIVVPSGSEPEPHPTFELRRRVRAFLEARAPAGLEGGIEVSGPHYHRIGAEAAVAPLDVGSAGPTLAAVERTLRDFFHPLRGGPEGAGWPFGRDVFLSDVAAKLEAVEGVAYVASLGLLLDGTPAGERVDVPAERIVAAGPQRLSLVAMEG